MKAKSLLLLLLTATICMANEEDLFMPGDMINDGIELTDGAYTTFTTLNGTQLTSSNYEDGISSEAKYVGSIGYDEDKEAIYLYNNKFLATSTSGGRLKKVTVEWASDGNVESGIKRSILDVYGRTSSLNGNESKANATKKAEKIASITYSAESTTSEIEIPDGYTHVLLIADKAQAIYFTGILIEWEPIVYYSITNSDASHITLSKTSAEAGESVSMTITPPYGKELIGYDYGDTHVDLSDAEYTTSAHTVSFTMPAKNISVSATFQEAIERSPVDFYFFNSSVIAEENLVEDEFVLTSASDPQTLYFMTEDTYDATTITYEIEDESIAVLESTPVYNTKTGVGQISLRGYKVGETTLRITTAQRGEFEESEAEITIVVNPLQVMLVTEYDGTAFAATTTLSGSYLAAQEIIIANGNVYYDPSGTYGLSEMTWNLEMRIVEDEECYTLSNSSGEYLRPMGNGTFRFESSFASSRIWYIVDEIYRGYLEKGIRYSKDKGAFTATSVNEEAGQFAPSVSSVDVVAINRVSTYPRSLTKGNYATMCLPYSVSPTFLSGVDVYNITGKMMSDGEIKGIELEEETGVLTAGKPYVIQATASSLKALYGEETVSDPVAALGLVGNLSSSPLAVPEGCYGIASNHLRKVAGGTATVGQYKAYIDLSEVPEAESAAAAPGRRMIYAYNQEETPTSLEEFLNNATSINWNEPVYNTLGQQVGKGTTGVLIQNGQKFLVQ